MPIWKFLSSGESPTLDIANGTHSHNAQSISLIYINSSQHSHQADSPLVTRCITSIDGCDHSHSSDQCTITTPPVDTWSPTDKHAGVSLSNQNLTAEGTYNVSIHCVRGNYGITSGKYYVEIVVDEAADGWALSVGVATTSATLSGQVGADNYGWGYFAETGQKYHGGSASSYGNSWKTDGDVIGIALDATSGKVWFAKNGTWQASGDPVAGTGEAFSSLSGKLFLMASFTYSGSINQILTANFGHLSFAYTPPSGFSAWEDAPHDLNIASASHSHTAGNVIFSVLIDNTFHEHFCNALWTVESANGEHAHLAQVPTLTSTLRSGLRLEYLMEEISGTTVTDTSIHGRTGTLQLNAAQTTGIHGVGHAVDFPNPNYDDVDRITFYPGGFGDVHWTITAYVHSDDGGGIQLIGQYPEPSWAMYDDYTGWCQITVHPGDTYFASVVWVWEDLGGGTVYAHRYWATTSAGASTTEPVHVAIRRVWGGGYQIDGSLEFFCNGVKVGTTVVTNETIGGLPSNHQESYFNVNCVGARYPAAWAGSAISRTNGQIDNLRYYDRALTDQEILFLARENFGGFIPFDPIHSHVCDSPNVHPDTLSIAECTHSHVADVVPLEVSLVVSDYASGGSYDSPACEEVLAGINDYTSASTYNIVVFEVQNYVLEVDDYHSNGTYYSGNFTIAPLNARSRTKYDIVELDQQYLNIQLAGALESPEDELVADYHRIGALLSPDDDLSGTYWTAPGFSGTLLSEQDDVVGECNVVLNLAGSADTLSASLDVSYVFVFSGETQNDRVSATIIPSPLFSSQCVSTFDKIVASLESAAFWGAVELAGQHDYLSGFIMPGRTFSGSMSEINEILEAILYQDPQFIASLTESSVDRIVASLYAGNRFVGYTLRWPITKPRFSGAMTTLPDSMSGDWDGGGV